MNKTPLKAGKIKFEVDASEKKFKNASNPTPNLQNKRLFDLAYEATFSTKK